MTDDKLGQKKGSLVEGPRVIDDDSIVDNAIREFIRCNIEKSRLSTEGNITDDD